MGKRFVTVLVGTLVAFAGCGGGGGAGAGVPLVSGSLTGEYKSQPFTPAFGVATVYQGQSLIALGDGPLNCASPMRPNPPAGTNAVIELSALDVGTYSMVFVDIIQNKGSFQGFGSNSGTVTITASTASSVAGTVMYNDIDGATNLSYGISGDFEVERCP